MAPHLRRDDQKTRNPAPARTLWHPQRAYSPPVSYSLHRPPAGMTGFLRLIWPLIFVQLAVLKAWVRKHYGPGMPYGYTVSRWGRVSLRPLPK